MNNKYTPWNPLKRQKYFYKLVNVNDDNTYTSSNKDLPVEYTLTYEIGKETKPKLGKVFVFDKLKNAKDFMSAWGSSAILKVTVTGIPSKPSKIIRSISLSTNSIGMYWEAIQNGYRYVIDYGTTEKVPVGTVFVDSVTPVKIVYIVKGLGYELQ